MKTNEENIKPTLSKPVNDQSKGFEKNFSKTMRQTAPDVKLNEYDALLSESEYSLKKKIFSLAKMESLVFADPKLKTVYEKMSESGKDRYGYHFNETIMNLIFNDYVLNSPKYLQKYKMAIPKKKKRRDKSGINQLKKAGEKAMHNQTTSDAKAVSQPTPNIDESDEEQTNVFFLVNEKDIENPDIFAYFPDDIHHGAYKTAYSHIGQHSAVSKEYANESREATHEEYQDLKTELEGLGYNLNVLNQTNETTGSGSSGAFSSALGMQKRTMEETTTSASSGQYSTKYAWGKGDLMKGKESDVMRKPIWQGGSIIQESEYLIESKGFEKYIEMLEINKLNEVETPMDAPIIDKTSAFTSNTVKGWNVPDTKIEYNTLKDGSPDKPNLKTMEEIKKIDEARSPDMYSTKEDLKQLVQSVKQRTGKGLTKDHIPMLADEALYTIAIQLANKILPVSWDDLPDTNSMWDYIDREGDMSFDRLMAAVKEAANDRLSEEGIGLDDLEENIDNSKTREEKVKIIADFLSQHNVGNSDESRFNFLNNLDDENLDLKYKRVKSKLSTQPVSEETEVGSQTFNKGDKVFDKLHNSYGIVIDNYGNPTEGDGGDIRLDSDGNVPIFEYDKDWNKIGYNLTKVNNDIDEMAKSKSQQRLFGMAHALQKGKLPLGKASGTVKKLAKTVSPEDVEDFASTKHKKLPEKVKEEDDSVYVDADLAQLRQGSEKANLDANKYINDLNKIVNDSSTLEDLSSNMNVFISNNNINDSDLISALMDKVATMFKEQKGITETNMSIIDDNPTTMANKPEPVGSVSAGGVPTGMSDLKESLDLFEEINTELEAYSIHHNKLMKMAEDRKPSALILRDRVGSENEKNFKKDLGQSGTKEIIDVEKELMYKDQQTDVPKDPQKLANDIEKKEISVNDMKDGEALKNVGDSTSQDGGEIPKRNMTTEEQDQVNLYRKGMHSLNYDNEPGERFEDRMKADMGKDVYEIRQVQMADLGKMPQYNKDTQPTEKGIDKTQFDKNKSGWNDPNGLKESMITGRYKDLLNKRRLIDFTLNEVNVVENINEGLFELDFTGLGNSYNSKTTNYKVSVNETAVKIILEHKFYTDGKVIFAIKNPVQKLNENEQKVEKIAINEQTEKMKHLLGYKPLNYVKTDNVKKNRGF